MSKLLSFGRDAGTSVADDHVALYVSGSAVASAHFNHPSNTVGLRADPIEHLHEVAGRLREQSASLMLSKLATHKQCNLVLAPEMYSLMLVEKPQVADDELVDAVRWQIQEHIDFPADQATLDVFRLPETASRDREMVYVAALPTDFLRNLLDQVRAAGLDVRSVDITELALRNLSFHCYPMADQNVAVLRLTSNSGLINVSRGDVLYLSRRMQAVPPKFSEEAWDQFKEPLLLQAQRSIDYYESAMNQPHCDILLVACTQDWSAVVTEYLGEMLTIPIRAVEVALADALHVELFNPNPEEVDWSNPSQNQINAVAAALPALGGSLRLQLNRKLEEVA